VSVYNTGVIDEFKNNGGILSSTATPFAQGILDVSDLAFDAAGNLYVGNNSNNGNIIKITPQGNESIYSTLAADPIGELAFNNAGDLFVCNNSTVSEIAPGGGMGTVVASGLGNDTGLAIEGIALPVPEPSTWAMAALGGAVMLFRRKKA